MSSNHICHEFVDTGRCSHSDDEHDALCSDRPAHLNQIAREVERCLGGPTCDGWECHT